MKKLKLLFHLILFTKKHLTNPEKTNILIYDSIHQSIFKNFFGIKSISSLDIRFKEIYILILIKSVFKNGLKDILYNYSVEYIKYVGPTHVICFLDSNINFYRLKKNFKQIEFISIQFAYRTNRYEDILTSLSKNEAEKLECDYIFCFSKSIGREYLKYINSDIKILGSYRNNLYFPKYFNNKKKIKKVSFISQFRRPGENFDRNKKFINKVPRDKFYLPEKTCLKLIQDLSINHKYLFSIIGCSMNKDNLEFEFYKNILQNNNFEFHKPLNDEDSYKKCYESEIIVFIDSTLGYEALSAGIKAISINSRASFYDVPTGFGWPFEKNLRGDFWTNVNETKEIQRVFNYIINVSAYDWNLHVKNIRDNILNFDENNKLLKETLKLQ